MKFSLTEAKAVDLVMELVVAKKVHTALGSMACAESLKEPLEEDKDWPVFTGYRFDEGVARSGYEPGAWPAPAAEAD